MVSVFGEDVTFHHTLDTCFARDGGLADRCVLGSLVDCLPNTSQCRLSGPIALLVY